MKFRLTKTSHYVTNEAKIRYEKLGFHFLPNTWDYNKEQKPWEDDDAFKVLPLNIESLQDLLDFVREFGRIVLEKDSIEIYDWYQS